MNNILGKFSFVAFISLIGLTACDSDEATLMQGNEKADDIHKYIIPEESNDTAIVFIGSEKDLQHALAPTAERHEDYLLRHGWVKENTDETATRSMLRARSVRTDTVYVSKYTVDYYSDPSVYASFNAKFSRSMVDSINKVVSSEYRISTSKTYVCEWRLFSTYYNFGSDEQVTSRPSLLCALAPATKSGYTERGYSLYTIDRSNGNKQAQMDSYQLLIKYEKVSHATLVLNIEWPFRPESTPKNAYRGYEFIYAVSKKL
ncbi:MAG: hypothetical protein K2J84_10530 [Bacteroidaceae bacterium]|nr:hypothetical protein [Bacteroidaceae bacterium]